MFLALFSPSSVSRSPNIHRSIISAIIWERERKKKLDRKKYRSEVGWLTLLIWEFKQWNSSTIIWLHETLWKNLICCFYFVVDVFCGFFVSYISFGCVSIMLISTTVSTSKLNNMDDYSFFSCHLRKMSFMTSFWFTLFTIPFSLRLSLLY